MLTMRSLAEPVFIPARRMIASDCANARRVLAEPKVRSLYVLCCVLRQCKSVRELAVLWEVCLICDF